MLKLAESLVMSMKCKRPCVNLCGLPFTISLNIVGSFADNAAHDTSSFLHQEQWGRLQMNQDQ